MLRRVKFEVYVDLDAVPSEFYSKEGARAAIARILNDRISHYHPTVQIVDEE